MIRSIQSTAAVVSTLFVMSLLASPAQAAVRPALPLALQPLIELGIITDGEEFESDDTTLSEALVVVTPGTDDTTLIDRVSPLVGTRAATVISYDESFWPVISGRSGAARPFDAPTFGESKGMAVERNLAVMRALEASDNSLPVIYTGYSQGAVALGDAAEIASDEGLLGEQDEVYLTSDGRAPWSIVPRLQEVLPPDSGLGSAGVPLDGVRDPADTGNAAITQVVVTADPVANFQWQDDRPIESAVVNALGFVGCHSDASCYGDLAQHGEPTVYQSAEGNTAYQVYDSLHPATMVQKSVFDAVGIGYTDDDVAAWDGQAEAWFAIDMPTPSNAAVAVESAPVLSHN